MMICTLIMGIPVLVALAIPAKAQYYGGEYACERARELRPSCNHGYYCDAFNAARTDCYNWRHTYRPAYPAYPAYPYNYYNQNPYYR